MSFYDSLLKPLLFKLAPETAHEIALNTLRSALSSEFLRQKIAEQLTRSPFGEIECFGLKFKNPVGIAAGFDKNAVAFNQLAALGFGFVEIGTTTFHAQSGNPKPRLFRIPTDEALINRAGFNNDGTAAVAQRLEENRYGDFVLGANIGKSKIVALEDAAQDYLNSFNLIYPFADYVVVNVSSPNTAGLRELQRANALDQLLRVLQMRNIALSGERPIKPLLIKIAPDLTQTEIEAVCEIVVNLNLAGIIATNTTVSRENLQTPAAKLEKIGAGGLSGAPLRQKSNVVIKTIRRATGGNLPIIGVGGIFTAADAFEKIAAGANLVQLYTGFVYKGFTIARDINDGLEKIFREKGFGSFQEAVGSDCQI
jgi:dihydroorotate dehydrogenase